MRIPTGQARSLVLTVLALAIMVQVGRAVEPQNDGNTLSASRARREVASAEADSKAEEVGKVKEAEEEVLQAEEDDKVRDDLVNDDAAAPMAAAPAEEAGATADVAGHKWFRYLDKKSNKYYYHAAGQKTAWSPPPNVEIRDGVTKMLVQAAAKEDAADKAADSLVAKDPWLALGFEKMRDRVHQALVKVIAKKDAKVVYKERKVLQKRALAALDKKMAKTKNAQLRAHYKNPANRAKIANEVMAMTQKIVHDKMQKATERNAQAVVSGWVQKNEKLHSSGKELEQLALEGVKHHEIVEEEGAIANSLAQAKLKGPKAAAAVQEEAEISDTAKEAMEKDADAATKAVAKKIKNPVARAALTLAMKKFMSKTADKVGEKIAKDMSNHVVFHHYYDKKGKLTRTKAETPGQKKLVKKGEEAAAAEQMKAHVLRKEKKKLDIEVAVEKNPTLAAKTETKAAKLQEEEKIARETAKEIEADDKNPDDDTAIKLSMTKARAKVKVISAEAAKETELADQKMKAGRDAKEHATNLLNKSRELARKTSRKVRESSNKQARKAEQKANTISRAADHAEKTAERTAERVTEASERAADRSRRDMPKLAKAKEIALKKASQIRVQSQPVIRSLQPGDTVHVHVHGQGARVSMGHGGDASMASEARKLTTRPSN